MSATWNVEADEYLIVDEKRDIVCEYWPDRGKDAMLIAAAPKMRELLGRALEALEDDGYMDAESQQLRADIAAVLASTKEVEG